MGTLIVRGYSSVRGRAIHFRVKKSSALYMLASVILAILLGAIAGYRPFGLGPDFPNYEIFYYGIRDDAFLQASRFEPGFKFLAYYAKHALNWHVMTFTAMLMTVALILKFQVLGQLKHPWAAVFFYILVWFPLHENTQIRAAVAIAFLFLAMKPLFEKKWIRYLLISGLAVLFHSSAILPIAILPAAYYLSRFPKVIWITAPILAGCLMYGLITILFPYFVFFRATLVDDAGLSAPPNLLSGANVLSILFLLATFFSGSLKSRQAKTYFIVVCFSFAVLVGFQSIPVLANRLREMLFIFMTFLAYEYRLTYRNLPQVVLATTFAIWAFYRAILYGLFGG